MKNNCCNLCKRACNVNRKTTTGYCKSLNKIKIAKVMLHHWEEPIISGQNGSGAIFFSNCNLKCVFCQNYKISHEGKGEEINIEKLIEIFKNLEQQGAHNINLVTPTHYSNQIISALKIYKPIIPIVWNTNSYESLETLKKIIPYVDIFLFDLKYFDDNIAKKYSDAPNYFTTATNNILFARKHIPNDIIVDGIMKKGIIIRHLVLPENTNDSVNILEWVKNNTPNTIISLMSQFTPCYKACDFPQINKRISKLEYKRVISKCLSLKLNGFMQELTSADESYIPNFDTKE